MVTCVLLYKSVIIFKPDQLKDTLIENCLTTGDFKKTWSDNSVESSLKIGGKFLRQRNNLVVRFWA